MASTILQVHRDRDVEHVTLNRPDVRNAFNEALIADLAAWAAGLANDRNVRAVVLRGAGKVFCAGADLGWMAKTAGYSREDNLRDAAAAADMFAAIDVLPVPVIARVHGAAIGGGAGLAAVADVVVAESTATFGFTEVRLGLLPAVIAPYVLAKIGPSAARELFTTGRRFTADEARQIGLVHAVVPGDRVDEKIGEFLKDILEGGKEAIAAAKKLIRQLRTAAPEEVKRLTAEAIADRRTSPEAQARMKAFLQKPR